MLFCLFQVATVVVVEEEAATVVSFAIITYYLNLNVFLS